MWRCKNKCNNDCRNESCKSECKKSKMKCKVCKSYFEFMKAKYNLLAFINHFGQDFYDVLKNWFTNTFKFSEDDNNKFCLMLWKSVCPYEYMD